MYRSVCLVSLCLSPSACDLVSVETGLENVVAPDGPAAPVAAQGVPKQDIGTTCHSISIAESHGDSYRFTGNMVFAEFTTCQAADTGWSLVGENSRHCCDSRDSQQRAATFLEDPGDPMALGHHDSTSQLL